MPPLPLPSEKEEIVPTSILPVALISTEPPSPVWDEEDSSLLLLIVIAPVLLSILMAPPLPLLSARESILAPSAMLTSPLLITSILPAFP